MKPTKDLIVPFKKQDNYDRKILDFEDWNVDWFIEAAPLRDFLNKQKQLIGKRIDAVLVIGVLFDDGFGENDEKNFHYLSLDEPVVILFENYQFEVWFNTDSNLKIGINSLTLTERSYQDNAPYWSDCSKMFSSIIGQKIKKFEIKTTSKGFYDSLGLGEREDGGDYIDNFSLVLENNTKIIFFGDMEFMNVYVK